MSEELKRCPCCGDTASYNESGQWHSISCRTSAPWRYVMCEGCGLRTQSMETESDAAGMWNRRADDDDKKRDEKKAKDTKTLRDELAMAAIQGQLSAEPVDAEYTPSLVAMRSYLFADAMLEARKSKPSAPQVTPPPDTKTAEDKAAEDKISRLKKWLSELETTADTTACYPDYQVPLKSPIGSVVFNFSALSWMIRTVRGVLNG